MLAHLLIEQASLDAECGGRSPREPTLEDGIRAAFSPKHRSAFPTQVKLPKAAACRRAGNSLDRLGNSLQKGFDSPIHEFVTVLNARLTPPLYNTHNCMPITPHTETHFTSGERVRDIVIGMSDGLTVPFALAAGLSGAVNSTHVVITAGLAEIAAGSIAMGLGGYLAARSDADHYAAERRREEREISEVPEEEKREVARIFRAFGLSANETVTITEALSARPKAWVNFMMRFELGLEEPEPGRALQSAVTIALSYVAGGLIPLSPYMIIGNPNRALLLSIGVTLVALAVFGYLKGRASGTRPLRSGLQTTLIGGLAAAAAFGLAKAIS
jgi:VIT1/CCC1 family predicted Fe2+/Mn2+ transporter